MLAVHGPTVGDSRTLRRGCGANRTASTVSSDRRALEEEHDASAPARTGRAPVGRPWPCDLDPAAWRQRIASAADPLVLKVGTDQDLQVLNPWTRSPSPTTRSSPSTTTCSSNFGPDLSPVPGFAESWTQDGTTWTFKIRPGMKWSDGQPATSEDARWTFQTVLDGAAVGAHATSARATSSRTCTSTPASRRSPHRPEDARRRRPTSPNTLILQAYVPILPKHIWSKYTLDQIGDPRGGRLFKNEPPVVGTGPYQAVEWKAGEHIRFARNPNYWGTQGAEDEIILQHFASTRHDGPGAQDRRDRLRPGRRRRPVQRPQDRAEHLRPSRATRTATRSCRSTQAATTRATAARRRRCIDPAFRDALGYAIDQQKLVDTALGGYGTPGTTMMPPYQSRWHVEPDDAAEVRHRGGEAPPRRRGLQARCDRQAARQGRQGHQPPADLARLRGEARDGRPVHQRVVRPAGDRRSTPAVTEEGKLIDDVTGPGPTAEANYDIYMWGWAGDPDPNSLLKFFTTDQIGGVERQLLLEPALRRAVQLQQKRRVGSGEAQDDHRRDAEARSTTRRRTHPVLRRGAARLPDRQVHRLGNQPPRTARRSSATVRRLQRPDRRVGSRRPVPAVGGGAGRRPSGGAAGGPARIERGRAATRRRGSTAPLPLVVGVAALVVIIAVGSCIVMRRRGADGRGGVTDDGRQRRAGDRRHGLSATGRTERWAVGYLGRRLRPGVRHDRPHRARSTSCCSGRCPGRRSAILCAERPT